MYSTFRTCEKDVFQLIKHGGPRTALLVIRHMMVPLNCGALILSKIKTALSFYMMQKAPV